MSENNGTELTLDGVATPCTIDPIKLNDSYLSQKSWRVKENSNVSYNIGGLILFQSGTLTSQYWFNKIYPKEIKEAHEKCFIHIHDASFYGSYCNGLSLADLIKEGLGGVRNKISSKPAKHLDTLCNQMVNLMGIIQNEAAGAVSFSSFDTYLAPFIKKDNLDDRQIKQALSSYCFGMNVPARWGCQPPFSNITLDLVCPDDLKNQHPYVGGKKVSFTYGECQPEMDRLNTILFEIYDEGDAIGNSFQYPIPTVNIDPDFQWDSPVVEGLFKITASKGIPYFANMINTGFKKGDIRSMCAHPDSIIQVKLNEDVYFDDEKKKYFSINLLEDSCKSENIIKKDTVLYDRIKHFVAIDFKVKTPYGFETPEEMQVIPFSGNLKKITLHRVKDDKLFHIQLLLTPDHKSIRFNNGKEVVKTEDLRINDIFLDDEDFEYKIVDIQEEEYHGDVYDFTMPHGEFYLNGILTHNCCRLSLDLKTLQKHSTGGVGAFADKTGSIGVVTLNLPRLAYLSKGDLNTFFNYIDHYMDIASKSLVIKRRVCDTLLEQDFYPYLKRYMKHWNNHFSTIGFVGLNEACENFFKDGSDIASKKGFDLAEKVLDHMRERLSLYQEETGHLYNLEASPAESTAYRFAKHDVEDFSDIKTAGEKPANVYYTNSCHLPVNYTDDVWKAIRHQEKLQSKLTGGSVLHCFLGESVDDWRNVRDFVKNVMENSKIPYITISPTYSVCPIHGILKGNTPICPYCKEEQLKKYQEALDKIDKSIKELSEEA